MLPVKTISFYTAAKSVLSSPIKARDALAEPRTSLTLPSCSPNYPSASRIGWTYARHCPFLNKKFPLGRTIRFVVPPERLVLFPFKRKVLLVFLQACQFVKSGFLQSMIMSYTAHLNYNQISFFMFIEDIIIVLFKKIDLLGGTL